MAKVIPIFVALAISMTLLGTCANERAITGGPVDKEAPLVIHSSPQNEMVNVDRDTEIYIKFNEQMKKATFASSLQIWPRPPGGFEVKSSWTWLKVIFNEPLDSNETYLLTLDKNAQDLRGNGLDATYVLAFTTGEVLNGGRLTGTIHGSQELRKNGDLLLYREYTTNLGELRQGDADYVFQPDDEGEFELPYLAERAYMLFYHWDRNRNKLIDGDDYFGRPATASVFARPDSIQELHKIWPQLTPLDGIKLLGATQLENQFIQVRTNRPVTSDALESIALHTDKNLVPLLGVSQVIEDDFAMNFDIATPLIPGAELWLTHFQDTSGFILNSDTLKLQEVASFDTLALGLIDVTWGSGSATKFPGESASIHLSATLPFFFQGDSGFQLVDKQNDSLEFNGSLKKINSMLWEFTPDTVLADGHNYGWQIDTRFIFSPLNGQELDSLIEGRLESIPMDSLGSVSIMHYGSHTLQCHLIGENVSRDFQLKPRNSIVLEELPAGQYSLQAYFDKNGDGRYNSGGLEAVSKSEEFWVYPDEIRVRARWETELGLWRF